MDRSAKQDLYELLRVSPDATPEEIRSVYRDLARVYHPDSRFFDDLLGVTRPRPEALAYFALLTAAYHTLSDPARRAAYDASRGRTLPQCSRSAPGKREAAVGGKRFEARPVFIKKAKKRRSLVARFLARLGSLS